MNKCNWYLTKLGNDSNLERLQASVEKTGRTCQILSVGEMYQRFEHNQKFEENSVLQTSCNLAERLSQTYNQIRYSFINCAHHDNWFNRNYSILWNTKLSELTVPFLSKIDSGHVFNSMFFIKPNNPYKTFDSVVLHVSNLEEYKEKFKHRDLLEEKHDIVICPVRKIISESRFVICNGKVITGSYYRKNNILCEEEIDVSNFNPHGQYQMVLNNAIKFFGNDYYCIDIAELPDGNLKVLEFSDFTCCGLYACDTDKIVKAISKYVENVNA